MCERNKWVLRLNWWHGDLFLLLRSFNIMVGQWTVENGQKGGHLIMLFWIPTPISIIRWTGKIGGFQASRWQAGGGENPQPARRMTGQTDLPTNRTKITVNPYPIIWCHYHKLPITDNLARNCSLFYYWQPGHETLPIGLMAGLAYNW